MITVSIRRCDLNFLINYVHRKRLQKPKPFASKTVWNFSYPILLPLYKESKLNWMWLWTPWPSIDGPSLTGLVVCITNIFPDTLKLSFFITRQTGKNSGSWSWVNGATATEIPNAICAGETSSSNYGLALASSGFSSKCMVTYPITDDRKSFCKKSL